MIIEKLRDYGLALANNKIITDIRIGLSYTCVELNNTDTGVAYTPKNNELTCCMAGKNEFLIDERAQKVIQKLGSNNHLENALALAAINAIVNDKVQNYTEGDIKKLISLKEEDQIAMVGYFSPLVDYFRGKSNRLNIFEKKQQKGVLGIEELDKIAPLCNVAVITATTIINNEIDLYIEKFKHCREIIILGPSTPIIKEIFFPLGVTVLSGIQVVNNERIKQIISHGFGTRHFKNNVRKINLSDK